jgi:hypothetical protein
VSSVARIADVLRLFDQAPGQVYVDARSLDGIGHESTQISPPFPCGVPLPQLSLLADNWGVRLAPFACDGGRWVAAPLLVALWRPQILVQTSAQGVCRVVTPDAEAAIAAGLRVMPPPTVAVDAGHEVWAGWALETPITDMARAGDLLCAVAARVGADAEAFAALDKAHTSAARESLTLPLGGIIRNWNNQPPEYVRVLDVAPSRRYTLDALLSVGVTL